MSSGLPPSSCVAIEPAMFFSGGQRIAARLYRPDGPMSRPRPAVVVCNGMRGVKEWIVPQFGEVFAAAGFVAIVFDHRGVGESGGEPGRVLPSDQVEDVRNAMTYLSTLPDVDSERIVLWGTSFGGANAVCAAAIDQRAKAVVAQVPFGDWGRVMRTTLAPEKHAALVRDIEADRAARVVTGVSGLTSPDRMLDNDESRRAKQRSERDVGERPEMLFTYESVERCLEYRPEAVVHLISPRPILILGSQIDRVIPFSEFQSLYDHAAEPKQFHSVDVGHYDICEPPGSIEVAHVALEFFRTVVEHPAP